MKGNHQKFQVYISDLFFEICDQNYVSKTMQNFSKIEDSEFFLFVELSGGVGVIKFTHTGKNFF